MVNTKSKLHTTTVKRKILAAFLLAFIAILLAVGITHFSFREMMGTVNELSAPNEKLTRLNKLFEEITMLDQQQRAEAIQDPQKPYKYFLDQTGFLHTMIDSLMMMSWGKTQRKRLQSLDDMLDERNQLFISYLKVKAELADNREFSGQLDTLATLLRESQLNTDSSVVTTQKKTITTYFKTDTIKRDPEEKKFLRKLFSKKKNKTSENAPVKVQEELNVTVDTLTVAHQSIDMLEIQKLMNELETDQLSQRKKLQGKELELIHANSLFINQLLNTLHEVENEELKNMRETNKHAATVVNQNISRMSILMLSFSLAAAFLVYLILMDISKSNYYKAQLEKAKNEAEELGLIKQRFLANMSHEIRTPLQSIIGFAEQLQQRKNTDDAAVDAIHSSSEHLLQIVNEVLDYSRISSGKFTLSKDKFKLLALLREVESAMRIQAERKKLDFISDTEKASEYTLLGDPFRLRQILYNLLGNAIKFTQQGFIKLSVHTFEEENYVRCIFEITDTGIGIGPEELARIFNQFEQANSAIARNYGGTGLGLTIVKSLVDAQQGTLDVFSKPGMGSLFKVALQFEKISSYHHAEIPQPITMIVPAFPGKVMVVDDDDMILRLCSLILKKKSIDHITFNDASRVLTMPADRNVTHIFLDIRMPNINGVELCQAMREKYAATTKFIGLTAHVLPEERETLMKAGFDHVLTKPFHESELLKHLGIMLTDEVQPDMPDFSLVRQMTLGDDSLFQSVVSQFVEETTEDVSQLKKNLLTNNEKNIRETIHKMAGRLGQMGAAQIASQLSDIEVALVDGKSASELTQKIQDVIKKISDLLGNIRLTKTLHLS